MFGFNRDFRFIEAETAAQVSIELTRQTDHRGRNVYAAALREMDG